MRREYVIPSILGIVLIIIFAAGFVSLKIVSKRYEETRKRLDEFMKLMDEYESLKMRIDFLERRLSSGMSSSLIEEADRIINSKGLKERLRSIKPVSRKDAMGMVIEEGEVNLERLRMNEFLNLVYQFSEGGSPLRIKKISVKRVFDNMELLDVSILVSSVIKSGAGNER